MKAYYQDSQVTLFCGDCREVLPGLTPWSVDLVVTSPPYAERRATHYGGVAPVRYVTWFLEATAGLATALKPTGTFILNIKEGADGGERSTYVLELILALRAAGWRWTEEFIWRKRNPVPGKWPNRLRDGWERLLQFNLQSRFAMYQDAVRRPASPFTVERFAHMGGKDVVRCQSGNGSGFGVKKLNMAGLTTAYPDNVLETKVGTNVSGLTDHPAEFPPSVPDFFIRLFTQPGDVVLDPFAGSGTTLRVAKDLGRIGVGVEIKAEYCDLAVERLRQEILPFSEAV